MHRIFERLRVLLFSKTALKIIIFVAGGFLFYKKRDKVKNSLLKNSGFLVAVIHGVLLSLIALVYRLIVALNWIIQQAR